MTARALVETLAPGELIITGDEHHYLFRVRRLTIGDAIDVADADGRTARATVASIAADRAIVIVDEIRAARPRPRITILQALIKGERMDWCVEKLGEVGADAIALVETSRAVVKLDGPRGEARRGRLEAIARAAARQSRQAVPDVLGPMTLAQALAIPADRKVVCHPGADDAPLVPTGGSVAVLVGPEGGLSPAEIDQAIAAGFSPVSLGSGVLRAETAGVVACARLRM